MVQESRATAESGLWEASGHVGDRVHIGRAYGWTAVVPGGLGDRLALCHLKDPGTAVSRTARGLSEEPAVPGHETAGTV